MNPIERLARSVSTLSEATFPTVNFNHNPRNFPHGKQVRIGGKQLTLWSIYRALVKPPSGSEPGLGINSFGIQKVEDPDSGGMVHILYAMIAVPDSSPEVDAMWICPKRFDSVEDAAAEANAILKKGYINTTDPEVAAGGVLNVLRSLHWKPSNQTESTEDVSENVATRVKFKPSSHRIPPGGQLIRNGTNSSIIFERLMWHRPTEPGSTQFGIHGFGLTKEAQIVAGAPGGMGLQTYRLTTLVRMSKEWERESGVYRLKKAFNDIEEAERFATVTLKAATNADDQTPFDISARTGAVLSGGMWQHLTHNEAVEYGQEFDMNIAEGKQAPSSMESEIRSSGPVYASWLDKNKGRVQLAALLDFVRLVVDRQKYSIGNPPEASLEDAVADYAFMAGRRAERLPPAVEKIAIMLKVPAGKEYENGASTRNTSVTSRAEYLKHYGESTLAEGPKPSGGWAALERMAKTMVRDGEGGLKYVGVLKGKKGEDALMTGSIVKRSPEGHYLVLFDHSHKDQDGYDIYTKLAVVDLKNDGIKTEAVSDRFAMMTDAEISKWWENYGAVECSGRPVALAELGRRGIGTKRIEEGRPAMTDAKRALAKINEIWSAVSAVAGYKRELADADPELSKVWQQIRDAIYDGVLALRHPHVEAVTEEAGKVQGDRRILREKLIEIYRGLKELEAWKSTFEDSDLYKDWSKIMGWLEASMRRFRASGEVGEATIIDTTSGKPEAEIFASIKKILSATSVKFSELEPLSKRHGHGWDASVSAKVDNRFVKFDFGFTLDSVDTKVSIDAKDGRGQHMKRFEFERDAADQPESAARKLLSPILKYLKSMDVFESTTTAMLAKAENLLAMVDGPGLNIPASTVGGSIFTAPPKLTPPNTEKINACVKSFLATQGAWEAAFGAVLGGKMTFIQPMTYSADGSTVSIDGRIEGPDLGAPSGRVTFTNDEVSVLVAPLGSLGPAKATQLSPDEFCYADPVAVVSRAA